MSGDPAGKGRRKLLRRAAAATVGLALGAGAGAALLEPSRPSRIASASPSPSPSATPTVADATASPTPSPAPSSAASRAPRFANIIGLRLDEPTQSYHALAGNPYGLAADAYAGEHVTYSLGVEFLPMEARWVTEQSDGVVLVGPVIRALSALANTPEAVAAERWQIPLPLDPRSATRAVTVFEAQAGSVLYVGVRELAAEVGFVSPLVEEVTVVQGVSFIGGTNTTLNYLPPALTAERRSLGFNHFGVVRVKPGSNVVLGQVLFNRVEGAFSSPIRQGTQVVITVGGPRAPVDVSLRNILTAGGQRVFAAAAR